MKTEGATLALAAGALGICAGCALSRFSRESSDAAPSATTRPPLPADARVKMVIVVRMDLKMGKGKVAAQCCHAAVHCVQIAQEEAPEMIEAWEETNGCAKVVVKCDTEDDLLAIAAAAQDAGMIHSLIADAGRTQIAAGSRTVCGLGPATEEELQKVSGHLKLL